MEALSCHFAPVFPNRTELKSKRPQLPIPPAGFPPIEKDWTVEFETFENADHNGHIFAHLFRPLTPDPKRQHRAIVLVHGQGEHSGRYVHWPHYLRDTIGSIYAIDLRGHGQSTGLRGSIKNFDGYADDVALAVNRYSNYLLERYGKAEIHLVGHSMGGLTVIRTLLLHPELKIASAAVSAPMIDLAFPIPKVKVLAAKLMNKVLPLLPVPGEPIADLVSRDPEVVKHYKNDPLNHGLASPSFYFSYLDARDDTIARAGSFSKVPFLLLLPTGDRIISPEPTEKLFAAIKSSEKKLIRYPDLYHEVFNEPEKAKVFSDLQAWIKAHSAG